MALRDTGLPPREPEKPHLVAPRSRRRWGRIAAWTAGIILALLVVLGIGIYVLIHTTWFHDYVLRTAQQKTSAALNTDVKLQNFALRFTGLRNVGTDLYGFTVYGTGPGAGKPLLQVDHVRVDIQILSFLQQKWNLENAQVDHPVVSLIVNQAGENNLPTMKSSGSKSNTDCL